MEPKTLHVVREHALDEDALYERGGKLIDSLRREYQLELGCDEKTGDITFWCNVGQARGVTGSLRLNRPIVLDLVLPGFLAVMHKSILQEVNEILDKEIGI